MDKYIYRAKLDRVVDGDTIDAMIDVGFDIWVKKRIRYMGIDTWESRTRNLDEKKLGAKHIPTALCTLNKETLAIDWLYRFDQDGKGDYVSVQVPQVAGNKLYQLTQNNVLHIFEKQENSI